jgi:dihydrofolate synthase / folylpolyglutamate synthase
VGLFTSPHISTFRERYQINGELVSEECIVDLCEEVFKLVDKDDMDVRFFEIITILGFLIF